MAKRATGKIKSTTGLRHVGLWATIWWGVSGVYVLGLVWQGKDFYVSDPANYRSGILLMGWKSAITSTYNSSSFWPCLMVLILGIWVIGGLVWLYELKKAGVSYRAAFKDLFLTIR